MKIFVNAKPGAKVPSVIKMSATHFKIAVREPAKDNKANIAILNALAEKLDVSVSRLSLTGGRNARLKIIELE